jgi:hypothetical protein
MAGPWEAYAPTAPAEAGPWDAFRTGGGTDQPADPARAETRAANGTFRGMLSGAQRAVEQGYTLGFRDEAQATLDGAVHSGIAGVRNLLHGQAPAFGDTFSKTYDESLGRERRQSKEFAEDHPVISAGGNLVGGVVGGGALGAGNLIRGAGVLPTVARTAVSGGVGGAATGFGEGEGGFGPAARCRRRGRGDRCRCGCATHGAFGAANRMLNPIRSNLSPEAAALRAAAQAEGIPLSVGQETGSGFMKNVDSQLAQLPGSAGLAADAMDAQKRAFNAAVLRRAGTGADIASPDVLNNARQRIGGVIEDVSNRNTLQVTPDLEARLAQIEDSLQFMPAEAAGPVRARLEQVRGMMQPDAANGGGMIVPGAAYRTMDSQLGRSMRGTTNGDLRTGLGDLREHLRTAMDGSISPADQAAWQQARREYANLMVAAKAAGGAGWRDGRGAHLAAGPTRALDQSTGGGYVWGRGDLNELARVGQGVLRQPPDSGTAGRSLINQVLTGGAWSAPASGIGAMIGGPAGMVAGAAAPFVLPRVAQEFMRSAAGRRWLTEGIGPQLTRAGTDAITSAAGSEMGRRQALAAALEQQPPQPEGMTAAQRAALARQLDR